MDTAVVIDAFSRRMIGWAVEAHRRTELVLAALEMAYTQRAPCQKMIFHSDHGTLYTSVAFGQRYSKVGVRPSMGSVGDAYDNALAEIFFASLECEVLDRSHFRTREEARTAAFSWIEGWYQTPSTESGQVHRGERCYVSSRAAEWYQKCGEAECLAGRRRAGRLHVQFGRRAEVSPSLGASADPTDA